MRIVLDNVEPRYLGVLQELADTLQFTLIETDIPSKRAEVDRRIQRLESSHSERITPNWGMILRAAGLSE